jgi:hypothetical protein
MSKNNFHGSKPKKHDKMAKRKPCSTSKLILLGMILLCLQIVFFCEYAMLTLGDTSAMNILNGIQKFLELINDNWTAIMVILGLAAAIAKKAKNYLAKSDENGRYHRGVAGDQTDGEWCLRVRLFHRRHREHEGRGKPARDSGIGKRERDLYLQHALRVQGRRVHRPRAVRHRD